MIRRSVLGGLFWGAIFLVSLLAGCDQASPLKNGDRAPAFVLSDLDGARVAFPERFQGQPVVLIFWADWCPSCRRELKLVGEILREHRQSDLVLLAVNVAQDRHTAARFVREIGAGYGSLLDTDAAVADRYRVMGLPTTYFIRADGRLQSRILGEANRAIFERMVAGLLARPHDS